jgi:hypothetical protein
MTTPKPRGRPRTQPAVPTPAPRAPGRPKRPKRDFVRTTINYDTDLYTVVEGIASHTGISCARIINAILRAYVEAENTTIVLGIQDHGSLTRVKVPSRWPTSRTDDEIRAQYPIDNKTT